MATDLAEVLGSAIALNLLFGIPIMGEFTNTKWNTFLGYAVAVILTILNFKLIIDLF
jgi:manganese transport protein mntH